MTFVYDELILELYLEVFIQCYHAKEYLAHSQFVQIELNHIKAVMQNCSIKGDVGTSFDITSNFLGCWHFIASMDGSGSLGRRLTV